MQKNFIISFLTFLVFVALFVWIPNISTFKLIINGFSIIAFPWFLFFIIYRFKGKRFVKLLTIINLIVFLFISFLFYGFERNYKATINMHFDKNDIHPLQFKAEQSFKDYIINNAKYPKSYEPLQFGNLDSMKISKLEDWELEAEERKVTAKNNVLELLDSIEVKSKFDGYGNYFFRHSYNLKNKQGKRLNRVAFIELDKDLKITNLFNEEDFTSISWIDHFGK